MGPVRWRDESPEKSLEDTLTILYPWFKSSQSPHAPMKNKGSLLLGNPKKYSPLARGFIEREKRAPERRRAVRPKTSPRNLADKLSTSKTSPRNDGTKYSISKASPRNQATKHSISKASPRNQATKYSISKPALISKSEKNVGETTWLQHKIKHYFNDPAKQRLGELPKELVKALWGSPQRSKEDKESSDAATDDLIRKLTTLKKRNGEPAECLMDVLLQSWTYFSHSHSKVKTVHNHVHAKYCEHAFGHFLLPDGTQVHGSYFIPLRKLITELRVLLAGLRRKVIQTDYKEMPTWRPPQVEEVAEFALPPFKEIPPLYPIEGLLTAPKEDVPANSTLPLFCTPTPIPHPPFIAPALIKAPVLILPTMRDFSVERKSIDYCLEQDLPLPIFVAPEQVPLPVWQEPELQPLPPEPQFKEMEILPTPILEPIPPYLAPVPKLRPCEASYYPVSDAKSSICDGLCGNIKNPSTGMKGRCLAYSPVEPSPVAPLPPEIQIHQEPLFEPPATEPIPEFNPPTLTAEPRYVAPPKPVFPKWTPPPPPDPIGYLAGSRPVFLIECSNTMAGERMKVAQDVVRYLFSKGGQVDISATHFDIIMYSFDAWSYGALEEERQYKLIGGPVRHWLKNVEVMQPKTPADVDKALTWMSKWRTGGRSNLVKALEVALLRQSADCIYLFTDGKPERPVLLMNMLNTLAKERGKLIPVYPVGLSPSKRGAWFMKNIAEATGGKFRELDLHWRLKMNSMEGVAAQDKEAAEDRKWIQHMIEEEQRRNLEAGITEKIDILLEKMNKKFEVERQGPRYTEYLEEERKAKEKHRRESVMIREKNMRIIEDAKRLYEDLTTNIKEKNKNTHDDARKAWEEEVQNVRSFNLQWKKLQDDWEKSITEVEDARAKSIDDAKKAFLEELRRVEVHNAYQKEQTKQLYDAEVKLLKDKNANMKIDHKARQMEIAAETEVHNKDLRSQYERRCSEIRTLNASLLEETRADFSAVCSAINSENHRLLEEAQKEFDRVCQDVKTENSRRQNEHKAKVTELDIRMRAALISHQDQVAAIIAEHDMNLAKTSAINTTLEDQAKRDWKEVCKRIEEENRRAYDTAVNDWEAASRAIQQENERRDRRRIEIFERAAEIELLNEDIVNKRKEEWKQTCQKLELEYQEEVELARKDHENYVKEVKTRNEKALEAAKSAYNAQLAAVQTYNETIRPYVDASKLVQKEIDRINLFLEHIVNKLEMPAFVKSTASRKRTLEQRLDLLSGKEHPCHPRVICEALQVAYADDVNAGTFPEKPPVSTRFRSDVSIPSKPRSKFEGMVPISPIRVTGHHCDIDHGKGREYSTTEFLKKTVTRQHEIAVMISPMVKARG